MISLFASALGRHRRRAAPNSLAVDHRVLDEPQFHWLLGCLAQCHGLDVDARLLRHHMPPPFDVGSLVRLAAELGLEAAPVEVSDLVSQPAAFPLVAFYRADAPETVAQVAVILGREGDRLLYLAPGMDAPGTLAAQAFHVVFERVALGTRGALDDAPAADAEGADARAVARFGFRWFLPELANHRRIWRDVLLASGAIQLAALATPLFTQVIIDKVVVHHTQSTLVVVVAGMAMFLLFSSAMNWARQYLVAHTGTRIDAALGSRVFGHLVRLPASYFERRPTGTIVSRLQAVETIREFLTGAAVTLLLDVPFLAVFLAIMAWYSPMLTSIAVVALALLAALSAWVTPMLRGRLDEQFLAGARSQALVTEFVAGMPTVKALQMESVVARRYDDALARHLAAGLRTRRLANAYQVGAGTIEQFMTVTILATGAWLVMHDRGFTVGMLVAFQMFASRMTQPVLRIVGLWQQMQQAAVAVKRLGELMDAPEEIYRLRPARAPASRGVVTLEGVGFRYSERHPFLFRNLDLTLPHGRVTLLTGPSGIGKSTLTRLLLGFERPTEGRILVDDRDSRHLAANELRALFGVVPQDTVLFADTIRVNLWLAAPAATFADIVLACRLAGVHDAIERMPDGYDTRLGERGSGLSGGQRQRIAIARALLRRPKLLVFDEATSHLDADTAQALVQTVNALRGQATILFVAHAVPPGLVVDQVVRMSEDGVRTIVSAVTGDGGGVPPAGVPGAVPA